MQNILSVLAAAFPSMYNYKISKEEEIEILIFLDNIWTNTHTQMPFVTYLKFRFN